MTGRQRNIGPPVYEQFVVPLALLLVLAAGIGPVIAWRRATASNLRRNLTRPAVAALVVLAALIALGVTRSFTALLMFTLAAFVVAGIVQELWRGVRARRATAREPVPLAFFSLVRRNRRRYGGYFVHIGIITLFVGVAASSSFKNVQDVALQPGQSKQMGDYKITYVKPIAELHAAANGRLERIALGAQLEREQERRQAEAAAHVEGLLPVAGLDARPGLALLRRRVDDRGRAWTRACTTTSGPRSRPTSPRSARASTRATSCSTRPPTTSPPSSRASSSRWR